MRIHSLICLLALASSTPAMADVLWTCQARFENATALKSVTISHTEKSLLLSAKVSELNADKSGVEIRGFAVEQADHLQMFGNEERDAIEIYVGNGFALSIETHGRPDKGGARPALLTWDSKGRSETAELSCLKQI